MTTSTQTCENCGHEKKYHYSDIHRQCGKCPLGKICKKFKPREFLSGIHTQAPGEESEQQKILNRLGEEQRNKQRSDGIICPYCKTEQDTETLYQHVSYWGEDSEEKITCEHCQKKFYVKEIVDREFETITIEWREKHNE